MSAKQCRLLVSVLLLGLGNAIASDQALAAGFLCADGIDGGSTTKGFEGCSDVDAVQLQISRQVSSGGGRRELSRLTCSQVVVSKLADSASVQYWNRLRNGRAISTVTITQTRLEGGEVVEVASYTLSDALVVDLGLSTAFNAPAAESLIFDAAAIELTDLSDPRSPGSALDCAGG